MNFVSGLLNFIIQKVYSPYLVVISITAGLLSFFLDTEHAHLFNKNKDYVLSFFLGLFNIFAALLLILLKILYNRYIF